MKLTKEEHRAIQNLKRSASKFPKSLWVFVGNGTMWILKKDNSGNSVMNSVGSPDADYIVDKIEGFTADGGDW